MVEQKLTNFMTRTKKIKPVYAWAVFKKNRIMEMSGKGSICLIYRENPGKNFLRNEIVKIIKVRITPV